MPEDVGTAADPPTHGCMACTAPRPYTVEHFVDGTTGYRCVVCGHILRLIPGTYTQALAEKVC